MALIIPTYWKAVDGVSEVMRKMANSTASFASKAEASIQRADRVVNKYTSVLNHAQKELLGTIGAAAIAYKGIQAIEFGFDAVKEYDVAITKLQTNFRLSDQAMIPFKKQIMDVSNESYKAAADVSEVFNIIGSKNRDLLKQPEALAAMAKSSITLSEALKTEMIPTAEGLTGIMAGWRLTDSAKTMDILAGASSSGSVQGLALMESLKGISQEAHHANLSLGQTAAMIEYIDKSAQDGGASATAFMRTILKLEALPAARGYKNATGQFNINSAIAGIQKQLAGKSPMAQELILKDLFKITTPKQVLAARALIEPGSLEKIMAYQKQTELVGLAEQMAAKNTGTLAVAMERVKAAFGNAFIESDKVGTSMNYLKKVLEFVYHHMKAILNIMGFLIGSFVAWKTIVLLANLAAGAWNLTLNAIQLSTKAVTLAQLAWDAAIAASPIGAFILLLGGLLLTVIWLAYHWNDLVKGFKDTDWALKQGTAIRVLSIGFKELYLDIMAAAEGIAGLFSMGIARKAHFAAATAYREEHNALEKQFQETGTGFLNLSYKGDNETKPALVSQNQKQMAQFNNYISANPSGKIGIDIGLDRGLNLGVSNNNKSIEIKTTSTFGAFNH